MTQESNKSREVLGFLSALRNLHPTSVAHGLYGGCFPVYLTLAFVFPEAEAWYDGDHVITKIGDKFYDIRGEVQPVSSIGSQFAPMDPLVFNRAHTWNNDHGKPQQDRS